MVSLVNDTVVQPLVNATVNATVQVVSAAANSSFTAAAVESSTGIGVEVVRQIGSIASEALPYMVGGFSVTGGIWGAFTLPKWIKGVHNKVYEWRNKAPSLTENLTVKYTAMHKAGTLKKFAHGRDDLIQQIECGLMTENRSALLLRGLAGVGKTALFQEMARRHITGESKAFEGYELLILDNNQLKRLSQGALTRLKDDLLNGGSVAEFNALFQKLRGKKLILFIDECHEVLNLKVLDTKLEELSRGEVKLLLATTPDRCDAFLETWNDAMGRRIPTVEVKEFTIEQTAKALEEGRKDTEARYHVKIDPEAMESITYLSAIPIVQSGKPKAIHYPEKSVVLLGEICLSTQYGASNHITREYVFDYYAKKHDWVPFELDQRLESIQKNSKRRQKSEAFEKLVAPHIAVKRNFAQIPHLKDSNQSLLNFCRQGKGGMILVGPSVTQNQALIDSIAQDFTIIRFNLKKMEEVVSKLNAEQLEPFRLAFSELCYNARQNGRIIFYIEDAESLIYLLERPLKELEKSIGNPPNTQNGIDTSFLSYVNNEAIQSVVNTGLQGLQNIIQPKIPAPAPAAANPSEPKDNLFPSLEKLPFFVNFLGYIREKKISFVSTFHLTAQEEFAAQRSNYYYQSFAVPVSGYRDSFLFLLSTYPRLPEKLLLEAFFLSIYYFEGKRPNVRQPDLAVNLINHCLAQQANTSQALVQAVQAMQRELRLPLSAEADIASKLKLAPFFTLDSVLTRYSRLQNPVNVNLNPQVKALLEELLAKSNVAQYVVENSTSRRKLFKQSLIQALQNTSQQFFPTQGILSFNVHSLWKSELSNELKEKLLKQHLDQMQEQSLKGYTLIVEAPLTALTPQIRKQLEDLVRLHQMHLICLCNESDLKVVEEKKEEKVEGKDPLDKVVNAILPSAAQALQFFKPITSFFAGAGTASAHTPATQLVNAPLFTNRSRQMTLNDLTMEEGEALLSNIAKKPQYSSVNVPPDMIRRFSSLYLKFDPHVSASALKDQFRRGILSNKQLDSKDQTVTMDDVFKTLQKSLNKDIDDIKDAYDPKLTTRYSKTKRKIANLVMLDWWKTTIPKIWSLRQKYNFIVLPVATWLATKILRSGWNKL